MDDPESEHPLSARQCGRCRQVFELAETDSSPALPEWWICDPCRLALLPVPRRTGAGAR